MNLVKYLALLCGLASAQTDNCTISSELEVFILQDGTSSFSKKLKASATILPSMVTKLQTKFPAVRFGLAEFSDHTLGSHDMECWVDLMKIGTDLDEFAARAQELRNLHSNGDGIGLENSLESMAHAAAGAAGFTPYTPGDRIMRAVVIVTDNVSWYGNDTSYENTSLGGTMDCEAEYANLQQINDLCHNNGIFPIIFTKEKYHAWWQNIMPKIGYNEGEYTLQELIWNSDAEIYAETLVGGITETVGDVGCKIESASTTVPPTATTIPPVVETTADCCTVCRENGLVAS
eukprot:Blabericola_migrator_1__9688@NODE_52_length_16271_cov_146_860775_g48_i0_p4_GENE_NODE_52_length_16271_cov_146_860775_g48_i0NODE_52_length_16271_cov_146_860775_g48_i0_p4_ORF_typecomplete_len290_score53_12Integrin_beta/PF00362_18/1_5e10VWA/PF00092_28/0_0017_NODE_52_length_16271_cov_146_860775_g48_i038314700